MNAGAVRLLLVGCGHMGSAILRRWIDAGTALRIHVVKPSPLPEEFNTVPYISWSATFDASAIDFNPDVIVLAVRPPSLDAVLPAYAQFKESLYLSIIAGKPIRTLEASLGSGSSHAIIRSMPNLPAMIGEGITFAMANKAVTPSQHQLATTLLGAIGETVWMDDESSFDAATAISGCGPGYIFALTDAMTHAGKSLGLPESVASRLARQTVIGSAAYMRASPESAATLRDAIGSPGTMTEAALKILLAKDGLNDVMLKAITAATNRAKELAQ